MTDTYKPPFGTYTSVQIASAAGQTEIMAGIQSLATLFGITIAAAGAYTVASTCSVPDFNKIQPYIRDKLARELSALSAAVDAMPTA